MSLSRAFRISGLAPAPFEPLFAMSAPELERLGVQRVVADADFGFPCRVSLVDAEAGAELLLLAFEHQPARLSPYRSGGAIFVRRGARQSILEPGELPRCVERRLMSVRAYDAAHAMVDAEVCEGEALRGQLERFFDDARVAYVHLHNARRGCYSCRADRVA
jgi:hypothetical protein